MNSVGSFIYMVGLVTVPLCAMESDESNAPQAPSSIGILTEESQPEVSKLDDLSKGDFKNGNCREAAIKEIEKKFSALQQQDYDLMTVDERKEWFKAAVVNFYDLFLLLDKNAIKFPACVLL